MIVTIDNASSIYLNVELTATGSDFYFFMYKYLSKILLHIIIQVVLLTMEHNWYSLKFQQIVEGPDFQTLHRCQSETQAFFITFSEY